MPKSAITSSPEIVWVDEEAVATGFIKSIMDGEDEASYTRTRPSHFPDAQEYFQSRPTRHKGCSIRCLSCQCAPGYGCVSKRASSMKVIYRQPPEGKITDLVIDFAIRIQNYLPAKYADGSIGPALADHVWLWLPPSQNALLRSVPLVRESAIALGPQREPCCVNQMSV